MTVFDKGFVTVLVCCALFALAAIPLVLRKVPRNRVYAYRTRVTLSDDSLWYGANAYFGAWLIAASALSAFVAVVLNEWRGLSPQAYMNVSILLLAAPGLIAWFLTARFIRSVSSPRRGPGPPR